MHDTAVHSTLAPNSTIRIGHTTAVGWIRNALRSARQTHRRLRSLAKEAGAMAEGASDAIDFPSSPASSSQGHDRAQAQGHGEMANDSGPESRVRRGSNGLGPYDAGEIALHARAVE